jgi:uncharacterized protein (DUF736 family)
MSKLKCGELKTQEDKSLRGIVRLIGRLDGELRLLANPNRGTEEHPDYDVYLKDYEQKVFHIGGAWLKNSSRVEQGDFLSLSLEHPNWPSSLNLVAFSNGTHSFEVFWQRPRGAKLQEAQAAA